MNCFDIQCVVEASSFSLNHNMTQESKENYPRHTKTVQNSLGFMPEVKPLHKPRGDLVLCTLKCQISCHNKHYIQLSQSRPCTGEVQTRHEYWNTNSTCTQLWHYANFALHVTHLVTCTELTNNVRGIGKNFVKFGEKNLMNIASGQHENGHGQRQFTYYDNKVYTFSYIT